MGREREGGEEEGKEEAEEEGRGRGGLAILSIILRLLQSHVRDSLL